MNSGMIRNWFPKFLIVILTGFTATLSAGTVDDTTVEDVVNSFVDHVNSLSSIDDAKKQEIKTLIETLRADEYSQMEAITASLAKIYPEYDSAIMSTQDDDQQTAISNLLPFATSDDKFLAADASFYLARTLMNEQRHEEAIPVLDRLAEDLGGYTLHAGPAMYFSGVAQANLLENQRAITSFTRFLDEYPDAPERLRVAAWRQIQTIQTIKEGALDDILQRMDFSRRRLEIENTDEKTQEEQDKVVGMLAKMIREQEKKECSSCNSKKNCDKQGESESDGQKPGEGEGQGKSTKGGASNNPNGVVRRSYENGPASPWSRLRERTRDATNNAVKQKLPARYRTVVEGYYDSTAGNEKK